MKNGVEFIPSGSVTSPAGFQAGATGAGIKKKSGLDLGILSSEVICVTAGMFTTNRVKAAPVILCQQRLRSGKARAVVVNSGGANACTGERGLVDGEEMAALAAGVVGAAPEEVLVASTGAIGRPLPMARLRVGMGQITLSRDGGHELARAIMTTDTVPKEAAVGVEGSGVIIGGAVKGSGMIHPDLATLLCFLTTDASVELDFLRSALRRAVDKSFNMVSVDTDTSTNDTVLILANGRAGGKTITRGGRQAGAFQQALDKLCIHLAKATARDGEGATRLIEVIINGAPGLAEARLVARAIVSSSLVKSAVHGSDPNWGRILAAVGWSGVEVVLGKIELYIGDICLVRDGCPLPFNEAEVVQVLKGNEVPIALNLNLGNAAATAWGCDLSEEYVTINSQYMT